LGIVVGLVALLNAGCPCTTAQCFEKNSGPDQYRVSATPLRMGVVINDSVSSPKRDRTDWKYVLLPRPGKLTIYLHWDVGKAKLGCDIFNVMGLKLQSAYPVGTGGLRAVVAIEEPGRYYIRVRAEGEDDESPYSMRVDFLAGDYRKDQICHKCEENDRKCLGTDAYMVCKKTTWGCNAWVELYPCASGLCKDGGCVGECKHECAEGQTRCAGPAAMQTCVKGPGGCLLWSTAVSCKAGSHCAHNRCPARGPAIKTQPVKPPTMISQVRGTVISLYDYRGHPTLHIELPEGHQVRAGMEGTVLKEQSTEPLPGGRITVVRVSGRHCIARTTLSNLGKNRFVTIYVRSESQ
jgi:hypothetical protein